MKVWILLLCAAVFSSDRYEAVTKLDVFEPEPETCIAKTAKCIILPVVIGGALWIYYSTLNQPNSPTLTSNLVVADVQKIAWPLSTYFGCSVAKETLTKCCALFTKFKNKLDFNCSIQPNAIVDVCTELETQKLFEEKPKIFGTIAVNICKHQRGYDLSYCPRGLHVPKKFIPSGLNTEFCAWFESSNFCPRNVCKDGKCEDTIKIVAENMSLGECMDAVREDDGCGFKLISNKVTKRCSCLRLTKNCPREKQKPLKTLSDAVYEFKCPSKVDAQMIQRERGKFDLGPLEKIIIGLWSIVVAIAVYYLVWLRAVTAKLTKRYNILNQKYDEAISSMEEFISKNDVKTKHLNDL